MANPTTAGYAVIIDAAGRGYEGHAVVEDSGVLHVTGVKLQETPTRRKPMGFGARSCLIGALANRNGRKSDGYGPKPAMSLSRCRNDRRGDHTMPRLRREIFRGLRRARQLLRMPRRRARCRWRRACRGFRRAVTRLADHYGRPIARSAAAMGVAGPARYRLSEPADRQRGRRQRHSHGLDDRATDPRRTARRSCRQADRRRRPGR